MLSLVIVFINIGGYKLIDKIILSENTNLPDGYIYAVYILSFPFIIFNLIYCIKFYQYRKDETVFFFFIKIIKHFVLTIFMLMISLILINCIINPELINHNSNFKNIAYQFFSYLLYFTFISSILYLIFSFFYVKVYLRVWKHKME